MKNETIKTYEEITPLDALKLLVENEGRPVKGLAFKDSGDMEWRWELNLEGVAVRSECPFLTFHDVFEQCAAVTREVDPCSVPEGVPPLEPWLAYVGKAGEVPPLDTLRLRSGGTGYHCNFANRWSGGSGYDGNGTMGQHYAVDVRTKWAQENFPEHCRIRNYQEPDAFEEWADIVQHDINYNPHTMHYLREAYELGQANPVK